MDIKIKNQNTSLIMFFVGIMILLFVQVVLSILVVNRINTLDGKFSNFEQQSQTISTGQSSSAQIPSYVENVSVDDDPWRGTEGAPITIIEFADFQCPYCSQGTSIIDRLFEEYEGQILFVYRDFPIQRIHSDAFKAAEAANCAGEQGQYWEMHNLLFANQSSLDDDSLKQFALNLGLDGQSFNDCLDSNRYENEIRHDFDEGLSYGVGATPTFFVNGHVVLGASYELLKEKIEQINQNPAN